MFERFLAYTKLNEGDLKICLLLLAVYIIVRLYIAIFERKYNSNDIVLGSKPVPSSEDVLLYYLMIALSWIIILIVGLVGSGLREVVFSVA